MSEMKKFGLTGVGSDVQFGKRGSRFKNQDGKFQARDLQDAEYVRISAADPVEEQDLVTKRYVEGIVGEIDLDYTIKVPDDGEHGGAINTWEVGSTTYSTALDNLNSVLGRLVPAGPPPLSSFQISTTNSTTRLLAMGADDNTSGSMPAAGTMVNAIYADSIVSTQANGGQGGSGGNVEGATGNLFHDGMGGALMAYINGVKDGEIALSEANDTGSNGAVQILANPDYPEASPGFYRAVRARINKTSGVPLGYNNARLTHSTTGSTDLISWVHDDIANPSIIGANYSHSTSTGRYSSGIKHLTDGDTLDVGGTVQNLTGQTYTDNKIVEFTTTPSVGFVNFNATEIGTGLLFPLSKNLEDQTLSGTKLEISNINARFVESVVRVQAWNPSGSTGVSTVDGDRVLVYTQSLEGNNKPHETSIAGSSEDAYRYYLGSDFVGDTPSGTLAAPTTTNWDQEQDLSTTGYEHEAVIVAGVLRQDNRNYTTGFIPPSTVDYTSKNSDQYVTFVFNQTTLSNFSINISGNYSGLWVALPGISDDSAISPKALGGNWWDAFKLYNGAGVPGRSGNPDAGCAVGARATGGSGQVNITFGTQSSTNSTNNAVIIRIKLSQGQSISGLSITNNP